MLLLLASCAGELPSESDGSSSMSLYEDWAAAYAHTLLADTEQSNPISLSIIDIDGDGVPEAVEWINAGGSGSGVARIYGYLDGQCETWYDAAIDDRLDRIFYLQDGDGVRCVAVSELSAIGAWEYGVYELVKITNHEKTYIHPQVITKTSLLVDKGDIIAEAAEDIDAVIEAHLRVFQNTLSALGTEIHPRAMYFELDTYDYDAEALANELRKW
jgi:hypothetical protein